MRCALRAAIVGHERVDASSTRRAPVALSNTAHELFGRKNFEQLRSARLRDVDSGDRAGLAEERYIPAGVPWTK